MSLFCDILGAQNIADESSLLKILYGINAVKKRNLAVSFFPTALEIGLVWVEAEVTVNLR